MTDELRQTNRAQRIERMLIKESTPSKLLRHSHPICIDQR